MSIETYQYHHSPRQQGTPLISPYLKAGVLRGEWIKKANATSFLDRQKLFYDK